MSQSLISGRSQQNFRTCRCCPKHFFSWGNKLSKAVRIIKVLGENLVSLPESDRYRTGIAIQSIDGWPKNQSRKWPY